MKAITEELCGHAFSASAISAVNKTLDESLERFAKRPLEEVYPYLVLDARYEKVRQNGVIRSQALGVEACRQGITTRFVTGCGLANELLEARQGLTLSRIINRYARYGVRLVDELGYVPFSKEGAELLFQILAERHERRSVIITSNLGFADWVQVFGEPTLTAALLDRLTHQAHIVTCDWESYRLKESLAGKGICSGK